MSSHQDRFIREEEDLVGKRISGVRSCGEGIVFAFDDGTWTAFVAEPDLDDGCNIFINTDVPEYALRDAGVITDEEYRLLCDEVQKLQEEQKRAEYERLKAEFEPKQA